MLVVAAHRDPAAQTLGGVALEGAFVTRLQRLCDAAGLLRAKGECHAPVLGHLVTVPAAPRMLGRVAFHPPPRRDFVER